MGIVNDVFINSLLQQKTALILQFEIKHTIDEVSYRKKIMEIDMELKKRQDMWIKQEQDRIKDGDKATIERKKKWKEDARKKAEEEFKQQDG
jgi:hypothetical protein